MAVSISRTSRGHLKTLPLPTLLMPIPEQLYLPEGTRALPSHLQVLHSSRVKGISSRTALTQLVAKL
jgi:hypothetical protein